MKKINNLKLSDFNIGILYKLEKGNNIINESKSFDPILNLLKDIEEIKNCLKSNPQDILYFLYFNMDNIERILYNVDKIIYFDFDNENNNFFLKINQEKIEIEKKNEIVFLFYMSLLIKYNINIVNFSYSIGFINKINSINKNIDINTKYKKILISKIILELINFYKSNQLFEEKNSEEEKKNLNEIEKENIEVIQKDINYFGDIGLKINQKELKLKGIDLIYAEIMNRLLKSKDFNDLTYKIIEQLDLENINITKSIFNEIFKTLSSNENLINQYRLNTFGDLFDSKKIDFYYILFKYILKNPIYIYYIDFLNETRKTIIEIIHSEQNQIKNSSNNNNKKIDNNFKDKIAYIIKYFTNSYYYMKYINLNGSNILNSKLSDDKETNKSSFILSENPEKEKSNREGSNKDQSSQQTFIEDSRLSDDNTIKKVFNGEGGRSINSNMDSVKETSMKSETKKVFIDRVENVLLGSTFNLTINNKEIRYGKMVSDKEVISYDELVKPFPDNPEIRFDDEKDKNYKKLISYLKKIKELFNKNKPKEQIDLEIKINLKQDLQNSDENNKIINSEYSLEKGSFIEVKNCQDKNILNDDNYEGFITFLKEINNSLQISSIHKISNVNGTSTNKNVKEYIEKLKELSKYHFICFIKVIGKHKDIAEKIRELKDGSFISGGSNEIIKYDMDLEKKESLSELKNYYTFFINKNNEVIISQKNKFTFFNKINSNDKENITKFSCRNILNIKDNRYILFDENGLYFCQNNLQNNINSSYNLNKKSYRGGIELTDEIIAATSNRILSKGENKLIFFNSTSKSFMNEIGVNNYSFTLSVNNCSLMRIPNKNNCKLLLFACKKYLKDDKNGILLLLLKLQLDNYSGEKFEKFYDTKNFEVYCFCPILDIKNKELLGNNDKTQAIETGYFFVGGFDLDKNKGLIKLYKVIYNDEIEKIEIEYIQDIIVGKKNEYFKGFKEPISCIFQSSSGEILVTCYDGNVYYFSEPNFSLLNQDYNKLK